MSAGDREGGLQPMFVSDDSRGVLRTPWLARAWRSAATGLCFAGFWVLALAAAPSLLAVVVAVTRDRERRARRVRGIASLGFRLLMRAIEVLQLGRFEFDGTGWESAVRGRLVVANHPCLLDAIMLLARFPEANCVMKSRLRRNPLLAPFILAGGYLGNAADPMTVIEQCRRARDRGEPVLVFPEGTRTRPGGRLRFRRGAAQLALRAGMEIVPATITCDPPVLTHGAPWFRMPPCRVRLVIRFHAPREPGAFAALAGLEPPRAARRLTRGLEDYFARQLKTSDPSDHAHYRPALPAVEIEHALR